MGKVLKFGQLYISLCPPVPNGTFGRGYGAKQENEE